jgi:hypothetical protein
MKTITYKLSPVSYGAIDSIITEINKMHNLYAERTAFNTIEIDFLENEPSSHDVFYLGMFVGQIEAASLTASLK